MIKNLCTFTSNRSRGQTIHKDIGWISFSKPGFFTVGIKEFLDEKKEIEKKYAKEINKDKQNSEIDLLKAAYENVRWVWQLIGDRLPVLDKTSYNEIVKSGPDLFQLEFADFLEGGGAVYLEPFWADTSPVGKFPNGIILNAASGNPTILNADWRDSEDKVITYPVRFGSTVYLNIYTEALYGHNLKVQLFDKDYVIRASSLGLTDADDKLFVAEYPKDGDPVENRNEEDVKKEDDSQYQFVRAVGAIFSKTFPEGSKHGVLVEEKDKKSKLASDGFVQKCRFPVFIDTLWEYTAGSDLSIYPEVEHEKIFNKKKTLSDNILKVTKTGTLLKGKDAIISNQVVVLSTIETNISHFSLCGYDSIMCVYDFNFIPIFDKSFAVADDILRLSIVSDEKVKNLHISLPDLTTIECTLNNIIEYHTGKVILLQDPKEHYKNLDLQEKEVNFDVSYPKPSFKEIDSYSWLPNIKPIQYHLKFDSCRYQYPLLVEVYPDLEYTVNAHLGVEEGQYLYVKQTKNYNRKDVRGVKSAGSKAARKEHNKSVKDNYKDSVDDKVKRDNFREKYKVLIGAEYKFADDEPVELEFDFVKKLTSLIENVLFVYDTVDSYLSGDQMNQIEQGEKFDEAGNKLPQSPAQKLKNKAEYETKKAQRQVKKKKSMPGLGGFPLKFTITPPKLTGGVTYKYKASVKKPNELGINYEFKLGALPLVGLEGRLDLLFAAQFIPYVGQVVNGLDKAIAAINRGGKALERLHLGTMEAEYYFDLVATAELNIDITNKATYHTIDGFTGGHLQIDAPLSIGLEAGGSIKAKFLDIKGEASISASATAKFKVYFVSDKKDFLTFEFEGIEGIIKTNFVFESKKGENNEQEDNQPKPSEKDPEPVPILSGFKIDIPLFKKQIVENPHKDEE